MSYWPVGIHELGGGIREYSELECGSTWSWNTGVLGAGIREYLELEYGSNWSWNTGVLGAGIRKNLGRCKLLSQVTIFQVATSKMCNFPSGNFLKVGEAL